MFKVVVAVGPLFAHKSLYKPGIISSAAKPVVYRVFKELIEATREANAGHFCSPRVVVSQLLQLIFPAFVLRC